MSSIRIGADERNLEDADPHWITQEIQSRRADGQAVCVIIVIVTDELNMRLSTPSCGGGGGGAERAPTAREKAIFDLWHERGLDRATFSPGDVVAFVKQLRHYL